MLDGVYHTTEGLPVFHAVRAPTAEQLQTLLARIIKRLMNRMHRDVQLSRGATSRDVQQLGGDLAKEIVDYMRQKGLAR